MTKKNWKTAAEALAAFEKDPAFVDGRRQREEERRRIDEASALLEKSLIADLHDANVPINSVWDLVNSTNQYVQSLPILLDHLQRLYPGGLREGIARAMAVPEAKFAWDVLVKLYRQEADPRAKEGLAVAISNIADGETLDELVDLARDVRHGESRILLLDALRRSHSPRAHQALKEFGNDPELRREVKRILHRLKTLRKSRS